MNVGRTRQRLAKLLSRHGFAVDPEQLYPVSGHYRSHRFSCADPWHGYGLRAADNAKVTFEGRDTMTLCLAVGILVKSSSLGGVHYAIHANEIAERGGAASPRSPDSPR